MDGIIENSYLDLQNCGISRNDVDVKLEFGVWKTGTVCPDEILWYESGTDFVMTEREGELKVNREDSDATTSAYKRTTSGLVEHTRSMTLKPSWNSRLYQKFADIQMRDSASGSEGRLLQNYSDGGFHMRITISALDGSYSFEEIALNIKLETFIDTFFNDIASGETEVELSMMIEWSPIYVIKGEIPETFAIPTDLTAPVIENTGVTASVTEVVVAGVTLTDPDLIAFDDNVRVQLVDATGTILETQTVQSGSDATFTGTYTLGDMLTVEQAYFISANYSYVTKVDVVEVA